MGIGGPRRRGPLAVTALLCAIGAGGAAPVAAAAATGGTAVAPQVAGNISTVVGGVGGPGLGRNIPLTQPCGVSFSGGNLYVAGGQTVREVAPSNDRLTTPAGTGASGPLGDAGPASTASLQSCATALDPSGNLLIADAANSRVRAVAAKNGTFYGQVMTKGDIYTIAGDGTSGYTGDGGPATSAELAMPAGLAVDASGNVVIGDAQADVIRVVAQSTGSFYGQAMTAGDIYTIAGNGTAGFAGDGGPGTSAELSSPAQVTLDGTGNVLVADFGNDRIRVIAATTGSFYGQAMTAGDIYTIAGDGSAAFSGDSHAATLAGLDAQGVAVDGSGNVIVSDTANQRIRVVAEGTGTFYGKAMTTGDIYTIAGNGTAGFKGSGVAASKSEFNDPQGVAVDSSGNIIIADTMNLQVREIAVATGTSYSEPVTALDMYTVAGHKKGGNVGDAGSATSASLSGPAYVTFDSAGNMVIADSLNGNFYGIDMTAGDVYTVAGDGAQGANGDGGLATGAALNRPQSVLVDPAGNLVISDTFSDRVRVVPNNSGTFYGQPMIAGDIYTVAGGGTSGLGDGGPATSAALGFAYGAALDPAGNLVIADSAKNRVRVVAESAGTFYGRAMTAGDIYTVAGSAKAGFAGDGGLATKAELAGPRGVLVDSLGNLVISDTGNQRVRVVAESTGTFYGQAMTAGDIYTIAGGGTSGLGDGGPATSAELSGPGHLTFDAAGNLVIADTGDQRVRVVAQSTGTFYGQAMTAGDIYTVAGNGTAGFAGDGGAATSAELSAPAGVAVDGAGDLLIADTGNNRIREVSAS
jgi:hypothetical protein